MRIARHGLAAAGTGLSALDAAGIDSILWGCLLAAVLRLRGIAAGARRLSRPLMAPPVLMAPIAVYLWADRIPLPGALLPALRDVSIAVLVAFVVLRPGSPLVRALGVGPLRALGVVSYSLYLWQQVFLDPGHPGRAMGFPINVGCALVVAIGSFALFERFSATASGRVALAADSSSRGATSRAGGRHDR